MFKLTELVTFAASIKAAERSQIADSLRATIGSNPHVLRSLIEPTLQGGVNCGDLVCHTQFANEGAYRDAMRHPSWPAARDDLQAGSPIQTERVAYAQGSSHLSNPGLANGIYRVLLVRLRPAIDPEKIQKFENEMREMAQYITAIRNWGFSRVTDGSGLRQWDYVWEQEFADASALMGPYMVHPYHFAWIDRWFDPESHDWILDTCLCHSFCAVENSILTPPSSLHT
jgi:hypothetical protein